MLLSLVGRLLAALPEAAAESLCRFAGFILTDNAPRRLVRRNMRMALDLSDEKEQTASPTRPAAARSNWAAGTDRTIF